MIAVMYYVTFTIVQNTGLKVPLIKQMYETLCEQLNEQLMFAGFKINYALHLKVQLVSN